MSQFSKVRSVVRWVFATGTFLLFFVTANASTIYYLGEGGSDSNTSMQAQSASTPWLTLAHAAASIACGDTIKVIPGTTGVAGDVDLPYFSCGLTTTIESSALAHFKPLGYRTNPTIDADYYGKLVLSGTGIRAVPETHGSSLNGQNGYDCVVTNITGGTTLSYFCNSVGPPSFTNGLQIEFEVQNSTTYPSATAPTGWSLFAKYYIRDVSGSTFKIAATLGGTALTGLGCSGTCQLGALNFTLPLQVTSGSANIVMLDTPTNWVVGTPVAFSVAGFQDFGTFPGGLAQDTPYYIKTLSGSTITVSATPGGSAITITSDGTGHLLASNIDVPSNWTFDGVEIVDDVGSNIYNLMQWGTGGEASAVLGQVNHMKLSRSWCHSQNLTGLAEKACVTENGRFNIIRDNYMNGFSQGESQAVYGAGSPGPTLICNNFMEAAGEIILYGGNFPGSGTANAYKTICNNYAYKPPTWRFQSDTGAASGACLYDDTDPTASGGEWYTNTSGGQKYRCGSDGMWATTASSWPYGSSDPNVKTGFEHKNGRYFTYIGNVGNYNWAAGQAGQWFNNSALYTDGPGTSNDHITILNNAFYNVFNFGNRQDACGITTLLPCIYTPNTHITQNNLTVLNPLTCGVGFTTGTANHKCGAHNNNWNTIGGSGTVPTALALQFEKDLTDHNTIYAADAGWPNDPFPNPLFASAVGPCFTGIGPTMNNGIYQNNIVPGDLAGECESAGNIITTYFSNFIFRNNALLGSTANYTSPGPGATNTWANSVQPATNSVIDYVNADGTINGDYRLASTSPYSAANAMATRLATDGTDLGADIDMVNMWTSGARAGTPNWDVKAGLKVNPGSTKLLFSYQAPTTDVCTATIYNAPARISGNQVASVADDAASSISNILARQLYVSGLTASTHYWYKLSCGGGVLMVGDFFTRASGSGTYNFTFDWSAATAMRYSSSADMSSPTSLSAATRQVVPIASNAVVYAQVGTTGPITVLIAP